MMTEREVSERWAEMCRSAEQTGPSALRVVESHLLTAMQDLERERHKSAKWVDVVNATQRKVVEHQATIDKFRALLTPPDPKHGTSRMHGLDVMCPQTGSLICVDVDYETDDSGITPLYVWLGVTDIAGFLDHSTEHRLIDQIAKINAENAAEIRAEARAELRAAA